MSSTFDATIHCQAGVTRRRIPFNVAATCIATALILSGCGVSSQASDAKQAADALAAGLQAQTQGKNQEAIDDYHKVLTHDPKNKYAYYNLGVIDQFAGRNDSAENDYRTALQFDPNFPPALFNLAILRTTPAPVEAESLYRHLISIQPDNAGAHLNLGFLLKSQGHNDEATAEFNKAVSLDPQLAKRIPAVPAPSPSPKPR